MYFGGNAEAVINNAQDFSRSFPDFTLYLINYRGYGGSSGKPQEQALYSDALFIYDRIKTEHSSLSVIGRSLGSGIATYLAAHRKIDKMLLITPFDSLENIAQNHYPVFPVSLLLKDKFDSIARVYKITAWTLIILAQNDTIVPRENSMRLASHFPVSQVSVKTIKNTGHNTISNNAEFYILLRHFFNNNK